MPLFDALGSLCVSRGLFHDNMFKLLSLFLGGGMGATLRYAATCISHRLWGSGLPGTLTVNVLGCLAIGAVYGLTQSRLGGISEEARLFIVTGLLGALTTFSTFNLELFTLLKAGRVGCALAYLALSCIFGLLSTVAGYCWAR